MKLSLASLVLLCLLAGCRTYPLTASPEITAPSRHALSTPPRADDPRSGLFHLSCTDRRPGEPSAYEVFDRDGHAPTRAELARRHYLHAAMANNAYRDPAVKPIFVIPDWFLLESLESESGLGLEVYGDAASGAESRELVVAYRGTNFSSLKDWGNNLALREPAQYREAHAHLAALKAAYPQAHVTVTGHSLGGGIALNMSLRFDRVDAAVFNASPRFMFGPASYRHANARAFLHERGELLNGLFGQWTELRLSSRADYGNYNFLDYSVRSISPVQEHGIYEHARALLVVAMTRGDDHARRMFVANIDREDARKDWENCRARYEPASMTEAGGP